VRYPPIFAVCLAPPCDLGEREDDTYFYRIVDGDSKGKPSANGMLINGRKSIPRPEECRRDCLWSSGARHLYLLRRDTISTGPLDEYDVTLIGPNMMPDFEE